MNGRKIIDWDRFKDYDKNVYERVLRDCID
jgi:hypothetical protein